MQRKPIAVLVVVVALVLVAGVSLGAAEKRAASPPTVNMSLLDAIKAGGWIGHTIIVCSIISLGLVVQAALRIRQEGQLFRRLSEEWRGRDLEQERDAVLAQCEAERGLFTVAVAAALTAPPERRENAIQEEAGIYAGKMFRLLEYISFIANVAPMLGLLGTVWGMLMAFIIIAQSQGMAQPAQLAEGISMALVTTVEGLVVAMPSLVAYLILRNRLEHLIGMVGKGTEVIVFWKKAGANVDLSKG